MLDREIEGEDTKELALADEDLDNHRMETVGSVRGEWERRSRAARRPCLAGMMVAAVEEAALAVPADTAVGDRGHMRGNAHARG